MLDYNLRLPETLNLVAASRKISWGVKLQKTKALKSIKAICIHHPKLPILTADS